MIARVTSVFNLLTKSPDRVGFITSFFIYGRGGGGGGSICDVTLIVLCWFPILMLPLVHGASKEGL